MRRSLNEIETGFKKAAIGVGWPQGAAEDIGRAAAIYCGCGNAGLSPLLNAMQQKRIVSVMMENRVARCSGGALIANATIAFDLVGAGRVEQAIFAWLENPEFLRALSLVAGTDQGCGFQIEAIQTNDSSAPPEFVIRRVHEIEQPELADGVDINEEEWAEIAKLVAKTFVPSSDGSRLLGAGAGVTDND